MVTWTKTHTRIHTIGSSVKRMPQVYSIIIVLFGLFGCVYESLQVATRSLPFRNVWHWRLGYLTHLHVCHFQTQPFLLCFPFSQCFISITSTFDSFPWLRPSFPNRIDFDLLIPSNRLWTRWSGAVFVMGIIGTCLHFWQTWSTNFIKNVRIFFTSLSLQLIDWFGYFYEDQVSTRWGRSNEPIKTNGKCELCRGQSWLSFNIFISSIAMFEKYLFALIQLQRHLFHFFVWFNNRHNNNERVFQQNFFLKINFNLTDIPNVIIVWFLKLTRMLNINWLRHVCSKMDSEIKRPQTKERKKKKKKESVLAVKPERERNVATVEFVDFSVASTT